MPDRRFYVYLHKKKSDGEIFYVGKGTDRRAFKSSNRSELWNRVAKKYGYTVEIFKEGLTEQEALSLETSLIKQFGRKDLGTGSLVNLTDGGETTRLSDQVREVISKKAKGRKVSEETKKKLSLKIKGTYLKDPTITLTNKKGETLQGKLSELVDTRDGFTRNQLQRLIRGEIKQVKGWFLNKTQEEISEYRVRNQSRFKDKQTFVHLTKTEKITTIEFTEKYGFNTSPMFVATGTKRIVKGWAVVRNGETENEVRNMLYPNYTMATFQEIETGKLFLGTVKGLAEFLGLKESQLCDITRKGKMKSHGWRNLGV